jgi:hypothetical protein
MAPVRSAAQDHLSIAMGNANVIRTNELQVWFVSEHVVETPLVNADQSDGKR